MLAKAYRVACSFITSVSCLREFKIGEVALATTLLVVLRLTLN